MSVDPRHRLKALEVLGDRCGRHEGQGYRAGPSADCPSRIWARWQTFIPESCRLRAPSMFIRQPMSQDTNVSAPDAMTLDTLSASMASEMWGELYGEGPAEPAAGVRLGQIPATPALGRSPAALLVRPAPGPPSTCGNWGDRLPFPGIGRPRRSLPSTLTRNSENS